MPNGWLRGVAAVALLVGCKAAQEYAEKQYDERLAEDVKAEDVAAREEAERPPTPRPTGAGLGPGKYRLAGLRVEAFATTGRNKAWDDAPGAAPDLEVIVKVDGSRVARCKPANDQLAGQCTFDEVEFEITGGSSITFEVSDRDSIVDDPIGTARLDGPDSWGAGIEMQLVPVRRLKLAAVTLAKVPTWWDLHGVKVLVGGGAFVVFVGGWIALANRRTTTTKKKKHAAPTCVACGARLANYAKCSDCGAEQSGVS